MPLILLIDNIYTTYAAGTSATSVVEQFEGIADILVTDDGYEVESYLPTRAVRLNGEQALNGLSFRRRSGGHQR